MEFKIKELKPIEEAQAEAEAFFNRADVVALCTETSILSNSLNKYQLGKTRWKRTYNAPHPSKEKRDKLWKLEKDVWFLCVALMQRIESYQPKP